jgi:PleD family two-component response regulator
VLTIDDDAVLTTFICNALSAHGIAARALNEPIKVLEILEEYKPDLVLLDVVMPGVSGYDVSRMLRAHSKYSKIPILFLTSKSSPQGRAAAFKAGGDDFLSKPILTEELLARVRSRLELSTVYKSRADVNKHTGLTTREVFERSFNLLLARCIEHGEGLVVVIIAIDAFQEIALSDGFPAQEVLFKDLAALLRSRFRVEDLKGHWTEGSFVIAFPATASDVVERAIQCLAGEYAVGTRHASSETKDLSHRRRLRCGMAELITNGVTADSLLAAAYERCLRSEAIDVSKFIELSGEASRDPI